MLVLAVARRYLEHKVGLQRAQAAEAAHVGSHVGVDAPIIRGDHELSLFAQPVDVGHPVERELAEGRVGEAEPHDRAGLDVRKERRQRALLSEPACRGRDDRRQRALPPALEGRVRRPQVAAGAGLVGQPHARAGHCRDGAASVAPGRRSLGRKRQLLPYSRCWLLLRRLLRWKEVAAAKGWRRGTERSLLLLPPSLLKGRLRRRPDKGDARTRERGTLDHGDAAREHRHGRDERQHGARALRL
eukprot:4374335-Prymnesium_polylepis.1